MELTILMPCLNEADTVAKCVHKARSSLARLGLEGEVLVADNGSTDDSAALAEAAGARVVHVDDRGYGSALMAGIEAARGRFVLMGDADDSYDFGAIEPFLTQLREGWDLVQGCRLPAGGGRVLAGAMPWLHRWIGNPLFTWLARWWFRTPVHDTNCGLRAFRKDLALRLGQRCTGMEFANEMLIKASLLGARITEVPITLHPDGRQGRRPHLRTFRDGWRTLRFYLLFSPRWLFLMPGALLILGGLAGWFAASGGPTEAGREPGVNTAIVASALLLCGYQSVLFALLTKAFAINEGLLPMDARMARFFHWMTLERGLVAGGITLIGGLLLLAWTTGLGWSPIATDTASPASLARLTAAAGTLCTLGFQTVLFSFFASLLGMRRR
ncbi:MAG: glycosyltransferase family 2 protein [Verrucomicrobiales bacterium]|nr:glycosyltransferase family 2 protein [Verrucomicrobiales bacterium]MCP5526113.1 glycosyltransferase family 2 protein [Verrucomicrobiales bacterium]